MTYFTRILKENEELVRLIRQHPMVFFKSGLLALIFLLLPFFLMFLLFRWEIFGLILFFTLLIIGLIAIIRLIVIWHFNAFLITDRRVILFKQRGLFDRQVSEIEYEKIQDISYRLKGASQTLFRYGSIRIQITNSETAIIVSKIPRPREIQQLLLKIKKNVTDDALIDTAGNG